MLIPFLLMLWSVAPASLRAMRKPLVVEYALHVSAADTTAFSVDMRMRNAPDTFSLAMAAHPEYDDRYYRYVEQLTVLSTQKQPRIESTGAALWRVSGASGDVFVHYRVHLPPPPAGQRPAWQPFIRSTGALVGGPHAFMYVVSAARSPVMVRLDVPTGWSIATGLDTTTDARSFSAENAAALMDSPMLVGRLRRWQFRVGGAKHDVVYWPLPGAATFDTATFVRQIERLAQQAMAVFGAAPYTRFSFLLQDGAYGGLEHARSVTLGAPSADLARRPSARLAEIAHEYFHTWNLVRLRPREWVDIDYRPNGRTPALWFSEGITMLYADVMQRRAALPVEDTSRARHVAGLIERYYASPGNHALSPEQASLAEFPVPMAEWGDYAASPHLQGELLGTLLDVQIRERTHGARSVDDVMRTMMSRHAGPNGFSGADVERAFSDVCKCDLSPFFARHVRDTVSLDFPSLLRPLGLHPEVRWLPALDQDGRPARDLRIVAMTEGESGALLLRTWNPTSIWGMAGLHTGDTLLTVNALPMRTRADLMSLVSRSSMGDTLRIQVGARGARHTSVVVMAGYQHPTVQLLPNADATKEEVAFRARWATGVP